MPQTLAADENAARDEKESIMKLKVALVGLGKDWQSRYLPAFRLLQDRMQVVAVYSAVRTLADSAARDLQAISHTGFREMISSEAVDAVFLLESEWYQTAPLAAACQFGKAVFIGSEFELTEPQIEQVRQQIDTSGIAAMAELPRRFAPATLRLKELIATRLGQPQLLFCHRRLPRESDGGARQAKPLEKRATRELLELIDWCRFIVDQPVDWVQSVQHLQQNDHVSVNDPVFDYQVLSLGFGNRFPAYPNTLAQISCGAYMPGSWHEAIAYRPPAAIQVGCERGLAFVDLPNTLVWFDELGRHQETLDTDLSVGQSLLTRFHRCVTSLVRSNQSLDDLATAARILRLASESHQAGRRLAIQSPCSQTGDGPAIPPE